MHSHALYTLPVLLALVVFAVAVICRALRDGLSRFAASQGGMS